jgi:chromosome partitioning protein
MPFVISVASYKGGVGKTTSAVHIAAYFQQFASTLLLDADANRASVGWAESGKLPFKVLPYKSGVRHVANYDFVVLDTEARPEEGDMKELAQGCDLLVIPTTPDALSLRVLEQTLAVLRSVATNYRVLMTIVPPRPNRDGEEAREYLADQGVPLFRSSIRRIAAFPRAGLEGVTVDHLDRMNLGWRDYEMVGEEIVELCRLELPGYVGRTDLHG